MKVSLEQAISLLNSGSVVGVPTETVYGLAASILFPEAIDEIFRIKGRPSNNPLIVHLASVDQVTHYAKELPLHFAELTTAFWPGPLTVIIPILEKTIPSNARAALPTAAFRIPGHPLTRDLLRKTGPLVMPSANLSGKPSATSVNHVENDFGKDFSVLDGGKCHQGVESTILYWNEAAWGVIRLGALAPEDFLPVLGYIPKIQITNEYQSSPLCPGQLYRHYSPKAKLILLNEIPKNPQGVIEGVVVGFNDRAYPGNYRLFSLGNSFNPNLAIHELYALLRQLDTENIHEAFVDMNFPYHGLWMTLRDRLQKAATP